MANICDIGIDEAEELCNRYALSFESLAAIEGGLVNSSFLLRASGRRYVLTVLHDIGPDSAAMVGLVMDYLNDCSLSVTRMLRCENGHCVQRLQGWPVVLKEYISGYVDVRASKVAWEIGRSLARLHRVPVPHDLGLPVRDLPRGVSEQLQLEGEKAGLRRLIVRSSAEWDLVSGNYGVCLLHGDLFPDNVLRGDDDTLWLLDWETVSIGSPLLDFGIALVGLCLRGGDWDELAYRSLKSGYDDLNGFSAFKRDDVIVAVQYACAVLAFRRYEVLRGRGELVSKKGSFVELVALAEKLIPDNFLKAV